MANVLIIEDESKTADTLKDYLDQNGHVCKVAYDGYSGLGMAISEPFDLILLDWMLPGIDGLQICQTMKASRDIRIVMITAKSSENDRVDGLELGADDYIIKPFSLREVLARVNRLLIDSSSRLGEDRSRTSVKKESNIVCAGNATLNLDSHTLYCENKNVDLTLTELHMLSLLMKSPGRPFRKSELILSTQNHQKLEIGNFHQAASHVVNLRRKLTQLNCNFTITTVYGQGYSLKSISMSANQK